MIEFLLFDNDGVLVETEPWYYQANIEALDTLHLTLDFQEYMQHMTHGTTVWQKALDRGFSHSRIEEARAFRNERYGHYLRTQPLYIEGVEEVLEKLSKRYKMAIVTTSRRVDFELIHHDKRLSRYFEFVLCEEDYPRAKPHPDPYLTALTRFGAQSHQALVIEDSQRGLTAAVAANIPCVTVHNAFTASHDFSQSTHRIASLKELEELLTTL
ncbi:MAG: HAD family hydrolase [Sulfurovum sp. PC08-66]|nr:MAG: HAD family hydrolase [Sulfurovum sp. PC08-66]KIM12537.1 MAG: HAD family hydrolase [Sulfuricurvum sp. PC08-66]